MARQRFDGARLRSGSRRSADADTPASVFSVVLLPAPLRPSSATTSRSRTVIETIEQDMRVAVIGIDPLDLDHARRCCRAAHGIRRPAEIGFLHARIVGDFLRRALGQLAAFVQDGDAVGELEHGVHVVLDQNDGAALAQIADELLDALALGRAQAGERLVEQQHRRPRRQSKAELEPALLAIGKSVDDEVGAFGKPERCRSARRRPLRLRRSSPPREKYRAAAGRAGGPSAPMRRFCAHGELREQLIDLVALGHARLIGRGDVGARDIDAVQQDLARVSGVSSRARRRRNVLLPAPLGPMMA